MNIDRLNEAPGFLGYCFEYKVECFYQAISRVNIFYENHVCIYKSPVYYMRIGVGNDKLCLYKK